MIRLIRRHPFLARAHTVMTCRHCSTTTVQQEPQQRQTAPEKQALDMVGINFKEIVEQPVKEPRTIKHLNLQVCDTLLSIV